MYLAFWSWIISFMLGAYALYKRYNPARAVKLHWIFFAVTVVACALAAHWYWCCVASYPAPDMGNTLTMTAFNIFPGAMLYVCVLYLPEKIRKYVKALLILTVTGFALFCAVLTYIEYRNLTVPLPCPAPGETVVLFEGNGPPGEFQNLFNAYGADCIPSET